MTGILFDVAVKKKNTISTLLNLKDTVETVQNLMRIILNYIETVKNLIQFVAPTKSKPLYYALIGLWVATVFIPGRFLILARKSCLVFDDLKYCILVETCPNVYLPSPYIKLLYKLYKLV